MPSGSFIGHHTAAELWGAAVPARLRKTCQHEKESKSGLLRRVHARPCQRSGRRYDLAYEHLRLIIEYDGRKHAEDARQWLTDIFRREELDQ